MRAITAALALALAAALWVDSAGAMAQSAGLNVSELNAERIVETAIVSAN